MASRLKTLCTSLYPKLKGLIPKGDLPYILSHYRNVCFCPLPFKDLSIAHWLFLLTLFLITRSFAYSHAVYYIFFRLPELSLEFTGDQSSMRALSYIDVLMWLLLYVSFIPADLLLLNKSFHKAARVLFYQIAEDTKNIPNMKSGKRCLYMLPFHESLVQASLTYFLITSIWPVMDEYTQIYARLPPQFHNPLNRRIYWFVESFTIIVVNMCISLLVVFPACLAYWIGEVLEIIAEDVLSQVRRNSITCENYRKTIKQYTTLFMAVREVNKLLKFPTFMIHFVITTQQMAETFTMLTVRDSGMDSGVSFLIDLTVILNVKLKIYISLCLWNKETSK